MQTKTIQLLTPLPCAVVDPTTPSGLCGAPATQAHASQAKLPGFIEPGEWIILPMCADCAQAMDLLKEAAAIPPASNIIYIEEVRRAQL